MKQVIKNIKLFAIGSTLALASVGASADVIELITNGEFEDPQITGSFQFVSDTNVPGWACTNGQCEIWAQGAIGSPSLGSDGLATGQHHEINASNIFSITTNGGLVAVDSIGSLTFDVWDRIGQGALRFMIDAIGPNARNIFTSSIVDLSDLGANNAWYQLGANNLTLLAGDQIKVSFLDLTFRSDCDTCGVHIDGVRMTATSVSEPGTLALFGLALLGLGITRRRKA
ncbi:MAG: PEP-CTERM sorting domain-containing protein [Woeseia sp.]